MSYPRAYIPENPKLSKRDNNLVYSGIEMCESYPEFLTFYRHFISSMERQEKYKTSQKKAAMLWKYVKKGRTAMRQQFPLTSMNIPIEYMQFSGLSGLALADPSDVVNVCHVDLTGSLAITDLSGNTKKADSVETPLVPQVEVPQVPQVQVHEVQVPEVPQVEVPQISEPSLPGSVEIESTVSTLPDSNTEVSNTLTVSNTEATHISPQNILDPTTVDNVTEVVSVNEKISVPVVQKSFCVSGLFCRRKRS
jgi:hypothetical protein